MMRQILLFQVKRKCGELVNFIMCFKICCCKFSYFQNKYCSSDNLHRPDITLINN